MSEGKEKWGLFNSKGEMTFRGSYEACKAEQQRRYNAYIKARANANLERQLRWQQRGGRDDDRDRS
ncbi:hypothetical protein KF728_09540 [Candidatus Obscuribacterales bacterium]|nr:hypothetical protein [Candidatus Obscuribacterales bacterium]